MKDKNFIIVLIVMFWALATAQILLTLSHRNITKENEFYNIFQSCALSVTAPERTSARIDDCWTQAEQLTGLEIKQFVKDLNGR